LNHRISFPQFCRTHPDRFANGSPAEKQKATEKFQAVADAYYVLSDPARRREYDVLYASRSSAGTDSSNFFKFASMFGNAANGTGAAPTTDAHADADGVFADVFDEVC
jgi:curved DNA-binding protein CbpA